MPSPFFLEDQISQIPALQLLQNLGYTYLRPQEVFWERKGKLSKVLLEGILEERLRRLNPITFKGQQYEFSDANLQAAIRALRDVEPTDELIRTNRKIYDLLSLGKSFEQTIDGETKSFTLNYIDWKNPENNLFHVAEEFEVQRAGSREFCRLDVVLFVNGIPFVVIECQRPHRKDSLNLAITQQLRNQQSDYLPHLFIYSQLLIALNKEEAKYGTAGTPRASWSQWRERPASPQDLPRELVRLVNKPLTKDQKDRLFADRFAYLRQHFDEIEMEERPVTGQDETLYGLCRPQRLIELAHQFIVFDESEKKVARSQQYFAIKNMIGRIRRVSADGRRTGGVIWHAQGSGRSLMMVMMAKAIALEPSITDPRIALVTDRADFDLQIQNTFQSCGKEVVQAKTGKHLLDLLSLDKEAMMTAMSDKFETAVRMPGHRNLASNIFVLVDENHHHQYGKAQARLQKLLARVCYLGFSGTPLQKKDKQTALKFGGIVAAYPIDQAVKDQVIVPVLYDHRQIPQDADRKALDAWFQRAAHQLPAKKRSELKHKMISNSRLNKAEQKIYLTSWDLSEHFRKNWQGTHFKALLTVDSKLSALKFKKYLDELGQINAEVLILDPKTPEGDGVLEDGQEEVREFWNRIMERYGNEKEYHRSLINAFKNGEKPEIMIVVDMLLAGFDLPRNTVLYLARELCGYSLLQAIARVNRPDEGKDFGYLVDYDGRSGDSLSGFDEQDLAGALIEIDEEASKLSQRHGELWEVFGRIENRDDEEALERLLADEDSRADFETRLAAFGRTMCVAFSSVKFLHATPAETVASFQRDLLRFRELRLNVRRRYAQEITLDADEVKIQKLIDSYFSSKAISSITPLVSIFDHERFHAEVDQLRSTASQADTIAHHTQKAIAEKVEEDPSFYRRLSKLLRNAIRDWREQRLSDAEYLSTALEINNAVINRTVDALPAELQDHDLAKACYGVLDRVFHRWQDFLPDARKVAAKAALKIERIIRDSRTADWVSNQDVQNQMKNQIEDYLYALKEVSGIDLSIDEMDLILDRSIEIAIARD